MDVGTTFGNIILHGNVCYSLLPFAPNAPLSMSLALALAISHFVVFFLSLYLAVEYYLCCKCSNLVDTDAYDRISYSEKEQICLKLVLAFENEE